MTSRLASQMADVNIRTDTGAYNDGTRTLKFDNVRWYETDNGETDGYDTVASGCK